MISWIFGNWHRSYLYPRYSIRLFIKISLLFHLGKLAEQVFINKVKGVSCDAIAKNQYAYRSEVGSNDSILQLIGDCTLDLDHINLKYVQLASLDFSKVFDRLQRTILIDKMLSYGVKPNVSRTIEDFLSRRQQCVRVNNVLSDYIDVSVGAPQGTKLGPILWLFYVNDLDVDGFKCVKYADDTSFYKTVFRPGIDTVSQAILEAQNWSKENSMLLNSDKTEVMNILINHRYL